MGRRRSESSPASSTSISHGARMPMSKRVVVPELPQSIGSPGAMGPFAPQPVMPPYRLPSGAFSKFTLAPSLLIAPRELRTSSESSTPERREVPSAIAAKSTARCEMDLSPGTEMLPISGPLTGSIVVRFSWAVISPLLILANPPILPLAFASLDPLRSSPARDEQHMRCCSARAESSGPREANANK